MPSAVMVTVGQVPPSMAIHPLRASWRAISAQVAAACSLPMP
jgi:hypothetical protein